MLCYYFCILCVCLFFSLYLLKICIYHNGISHTPRFLIVMVSHIRLVLEGPGIPVINGKCKKLKSRRYLNLRGDQNIFCLWSCLNLGEEGLKLKEGAAAHTNTIGKQKQNLIFTPLINKLLAI